MLVLALDTTTRRGSAALLRDDTLLDCEIGDAARSYGERLPGDLMRLLERHGLRVQDVDLFAVAAGPGSFTGLRIGMATMQGLALPNRRPMVGVSTLDALAAGAEKRLREPFSSQVKILPDPKKAPGAFFLGVWMDAQRGEVFTALYRDGQRVEGPAVEKPATTLARWAALETPGGLIFAGDGALTYAAAIAEALPAASVLPDVPPLAPAIAQLAAEAAARGETMPPDAIRPIYIRRPDVELARDRRAVESRTP